MNLTFGDLYYRINDFSNITFCFFLKRHEFDLLKSITKERHPSYIEPLLQDDSYFAYGIDTDDAKFESGFSEFVSYGINAPKELVAILF